MISKYEISCIVRSEEGKDKKITHIAGINEFGNIWKLSFERAIIGIEKRDWDFYISKEGKQSNIAVVQDDSGKKYLKAIDLEPMDLWDLPNCTF
jgi:hypothetical protein